MSVGGVDMATETYADTAEADAITTANAYTDTREVAITTAYQTYADTAEADAITTANAYTDTAISNLVDTAPTTLDTLNELAAALGDDANFSTTVTNSIATKLSTADFTSTADTWISTKSTDDVAEGSTNLYYTDARVDARISNAGSQPLTSISDSAPTSAVSGQMWWNSATGRLKIYYSDGDSSQWVDVTPSMGNIISTTLSQVREEIAKEMNPKQLIASVDVSLSSSNIANANDIALATGTQYIQFMNKDNGYAGADFRFQTYIDPNTPADADLMYQVLQSATSDNFNQIIKIDSTHTHIRFKMGTNASVSFYLRQYKD